ncbi:hypothetical protein DSECCO2_162160 [anaerobic digester metagenome]
MINNEQKQAVKQFIEYWKDRGSERAESQKFWLNLLGDVLGVPNPTEYISFEDPVMMNNTGFIDGYIDSTKVLIEQKGRSKNLRDGIRQSDGSLLSPFQQAKRYVVDLPRSKHPRFIVTCNFKEFLIYDMEKPQGEPQSVLLENLEKELYRLEFLVDSESEHIKKETQVSIKAGELVGKLYDLLIKQFKDPENEKTLESLNMFCVRIVFCLYAEDAGIFGKHGKFHDYLASFPIPNTRKAIIELFRILNEKPEDRDPYEDDILASFPYVNGGLFADKNIEIPYLTENIVNLILRNASEDFDWSEISPTIFGAVFESTLNSETRHAGGMHYTSIQNIHKLIDNLFLNDLKAEFNAILEIRVEKTKNNKLREFQKKLANLTFLDPACGSGNFLTETYISLRKLENKILLALSHGQTMLDLEGVIQVKISQFYGIEINDFATTVGKTALWIAESQMMKQTEEIVHLNLDFLPLKSYANIVCENALKISWEEVISKSKLSYIMGNPPFMGKKGRSSEQTEDLINCFEKKTKNISNLDYVSCWYKKANDFIQGTKIEVAFVSTNSITQGEQVPILWGDLFKSNAIINFAYRTFNWTSEAAQKAAVHCVIIGFAMFGRREKVLYYDEMQSIKVENINAYLVPAPNVFVESRNKSLYDVSKIDFGSMPNDSGYLSDYSDEEKNLIVNEYPLAEKMFKSFVGASEFINNKIRWCLWLENISPNEIKQVPPVLEAIKKVKEERSSSTRESTRKLAEIPYLFGEIRQPKSSYILIPRHSSENRKYIPIGFMHSDIISGDANMVLPNATKYEFGILTSNVHMAWVKTVCGRIKSDFRYSAKIVYNNFPWCSPTDIQKQKIEQTAQAILDARNLYPNSSLADLYNELTMPKELRKAHQDNDRAVMAAYGFTTKMTESECVAELMKMYKVKVEGINGK